MRAREREREAALEKITQEKQRLVEVGKESLSPFSLGRRRRCRRRASRPSLESPLSLCAFRSLFPTVSVHHPIMSMKVSSPDGVKVKHQITTEKSSAFVVAPFFF